MVRLVQTGSDMLNLRSVVLAAIVGAFALPLSGCYAAVEVPPDTVVEGYQPIYCDGYVVYYDEGGRPFYYVNGGVYWIPANHPYYGELVRHWGTYRGAYGRWYARAGYRYRGYRRHYR
jgi:hypothetical protein